MSEHSSAPSRLPRFVPFGAPRFSRREKQAVIDTMSSGWIGTGPRTLAFEQAFKKYVGAKQAVAVSSCTAALHLSLIVNGVGPGDEVVTTPMTFVATANAILMTGANINFADVDLDTYNLNPKSVTAAINPRTRVILPVHFGGLPADLSAFQVLARKKKLIVIEDAAHAIGARYQGKHIGQSGNLTCFSFYPNKNMTTSEGGMVTTAQSKVAERLRILRMHGLDADAWRRFHRKSLQPSLAVAVGYKYNLTDLQAALGLEQLRHVEQWQKIREQHAAHYDRVFSTSPGVVRQYRPRDIQRNRHALHLYTLRLDQRVFKQGTRDRVVQTLLRKNVGASVHYYPVHLHPYFRSLGFRRGQFPVAEKIGDEIFTLPLTQYLPRSTIATIAQITKAVIGRAV